MTIDLDAAQAFIDTHARVLDRRRFQLVTGAGDPAGVLSALLAYRNEDGGFGWALEPDMRSAGSQPVGAFHAFEIFGEIGSAAGPAAVALCDWSDSVATDGALPWAIDPGAAAGTAPWFQGTDAEQPSLAMTAMTAAQAYRYSRHHAGVAEHPWLVAAVAWCMKQVAALERPGGAVEFRSLLELLDAVADDVSGAAEELERLGSLIPPSGALPVEGGLEDEAIRALDFAPFPERPVRRIFDPAVIDAELDHLASQQQDDGGWPIDWAAASPAGLIEWRGFVTVRAVSVLSLNGRVQL